MSLRDQLSKEIAQSRKERPRPPIDQSDRKPLQGVGGWLLFFCISLTILTPAVFVNLLVSPRYPRPTFTVISLAPLVARALLAVYGIVIGVRLWLIRSNSPRQTQTFLFVNLAISLVQAVFGSLIHGNILVSIGGFLLEAAYLFIWMLYFRNSRRVANTFQSTSGARPSSDD